jgi:hypothetical protein
MKYTITFEDGTIITSDQLALLQISAKKISPFVVNRSHPIDKLISKWMADKSVPTAVGSTVRAQVLADWLRQNLQVRVSAKMINYRLRSAGAIADRDTHGRWLILPWLDAASSMDVSLT